jgi:hypothetical protein
MVVNVPSEVSSGDRPLTPVPARRTTPLNNTARHSAGLRAFAPSRPAARPVYVSAAAISRLRPVCFPFLHPDDSALFTLVKASLSPHLNLSSVR